MPRRYMVMGLLGFVIFTLVIGYILTHSNHNKQYKEGLFVEGKEQLVYAGCLY